MAEESAVPEKDKSKNSSKDDFNNQDTDVEDPRGFEFPLHKDKNGNMRDSNGRYYTSPNYDSDYDPY